MNNDNRDDKFYEAGQKVDNQHSSEDAEFTTIESTPTNNQETEKQEGPTYYTFGQTRPMGTVQSNSSASQGNNSYTYSSSNGSTGASSTPYGNNEAVANPSAVQPQYGAPSQPSVPQYGAQPGYGTQPGNGAQPNYSNAAAGGPAPNNMPYRPFTTSTVGGDPLKAKKEKQRSGGFGKIFLSFMAGVVAVGLLMYTADVQNWFSKEVTVTQGNSYSSGSSGSSGGSNPQGTTTSLMMDRPDNISQLFSTSSPAVVKIETYSQARQSSGSSLFDDPFFRQFFGNNAPKVEENQSQELVQTGMGTGFFFESDGYILTNQHVVSDSDEIRVIVEGYDEPFTAKLLGSSYQLDLAVIKIEGEKSFPTLPLGNSNDTQIGDWVVAIGNPYGFDHTLTVGVISAKERPIDISDSDGTRNYKNLLQTDASINPGNSGGPLLNMNGEVIGINTAVSSTAQGIGFAIPTTTIMEVLDALKSNTPVAADASPFIGVDLSNLTENLANQLGLDSTEGTIVSSVYYKTPAYVAGIKQYDVIIGVDDKNIKTTDELISYIQEKKVGDVINLSIIRDGEKMSLPVEIGDKNQFGL